MSGAALPNLPPADELHALRERRKADDAREAELRMLLLSDPAARTGNQFVAELAEVETSRTDLKELRANYPAIVEQFTFPAKVTRIELNPIDQETGEILPIRRKPALRTIRVV